MTVDPDSVDSTEPMGAFVMLEVVCCASASTDWYNCCVALVFTRENVFELCVSPL